MAAIKKAYVRPLDIRRGHIDMGHGAGGKAAAQLIEELFLPALGNPFLLEGDDAAVLPLGLWPAYTMPQGVASLGEASPVDKGVPGELVMACDGHVVSPIFFPGGDLGCLAVHGTVNDVAMLGARPLYLSASFILEEGFPLADLQRVVQSMGRAAHEAGVPVVAGDTKVVERGKGDGVFISTCGIGWRPSGLLIGGRFARVGDVILLSGPIGDHGVAVLSTRESLSFETTIESDTAALHTLVETMLEAAAGGIHVLRDPTRGGLATALNEIARQSAVGMRLEEAGIPVRPEVEAACELLGLDPLYVANEGKLIAICAPAASGRVLAAMRAHPLGQDAARIGTVIDDPHHFVQMDTRFSGRRVVDWLTGEQLPRIC